LKGIAKKLLFASRERRSKSKSPQRGDKTPSPEKNLTPIYGCVRAWRFTETEKNERILNFYSNHLPNSFRQKRKRTHRAENRIKLKLLALVPAIAQGLFNGGGANYVRISLSPYQLFRELYQGRVLIRRR